MSLPTFFSYARERYRILLRRREGLPPPWTQDPILQQHRFCNIFREDDRTTIWFREHVREPLRNRPEVALATITFRWFNRITTGRLLLRAGLFEKWDGWRARKVLRDAQPLVTGAFVVKSPGGMSKRDGLVWCIDQVWNQRERLLGDLWGASTLEAAHLAVQRYPYLGSFMAYEVVTDLRHTYLLEQAEDINTWAAAGPGAARGLGRVLEGDPNTYRYTSTRDQTAMLEGMRCVLSHSRDRRFWPGPAWEMREVEHTLCEFDKYERARLGEGTPKQRFTPCT